METMMTTGKGGFKSETVHLANASRWVRGNIVIACTGRTMRGFLGAGEVTCKACLKKLAGMVPAAAVQ